jgi:hypothetical protein
MWRPSSANYIRQLYSHALLPWNFEGCGGDPEKMLRPNRVRTGDQVMKGMARKAEAKMTWTARIATPVSRVEPAAARFIADR